MIRVLHIIGSLERTGAETFLVSLYRNINREKIQFDFAIYNIPSENSYYHEVVSLGARVYQVPHKADGILKSLKRIEEIVRDNNYKIVWRHASNCFRGLDVVAAKCGGAERLILHSHNTSTKGKVKVLHCIMRPFIGMFITDRFACGEAAGKWMFSKKNYIVVHNGIDVEKFGFNSEIRKKYRERYDIGDELVIGHIGRFDQVKNHDFLIKLFAELESRKDKVFLVLVGKGVREQKIKREVAERKLDDKVLFLGSRDDVEKIMQMMDVLVMPSLYEGIPVTLIEAQAAGLHCVVSDNISDEVNITGNVKFISLEALTEIWMDNLYALSDENRISGTKLVRRAGYDIKDIADWVEKYITK